MADVQVRRNVIICQQPEMDLIIPGRGLSKTRLYVDLALVHVGVGVWGEGECLTCGSALLGWYKVSCVLRERNITEALCRRAF